jgi:hypothetical protein
MFYTVELVKEKLPGVSVKVGNKVYKGRVMGRKNKYATVHTKAGSFEFTWLSITRAVNNGHSLNT